MNNVTKKTISFLILLIITLLPTWSAVSGVEIMQKVYQRDTGDDMKANLTMEISNSRGSTRERSIVQIRSVEDGIEKKLMFFTAPSDVKDTGFLSISYPSDKDDDQLIYLPALKRVKRIAAGNKNDSFMGSDFTYDDMGARNPKKDTHTIIREEVVNNVDCYVVQSIPVTQEGSITKTLNWIAKEGSFGLKKEFYEGETLVKTLTINESTVIDSIIVITDMTMKNIDKGTQTRITLKDVSFNNNFSDSLFSERQLKIGPRF
ncbi:MAG: outer membrane lipoprotein-sorting protein [Spirochaetia bacterium]|nr:outer membrane lipoprotein-sorting protein [Spirochaetia bacterium]